VQSTQQADDHQGRQHGNGAGPPKTRGFRAKELADTVVADELKRPTRVSGRQQRSERPPGRFCGGKKAIDKLEAEGQEAQGQVTRRALIRFLITKQGGRRVCTGGTPVCFLARSIRFTVPRSTWPLWQRLAAFAQQHHFAGGDTWYCHQMLLAGGVIAAGGDVPGIREGDQDVRIFELNPRGVAHSAILADVWSGPLLLVRPA